MNENKRGYTPGTDTAAVLISVRVRIFVTQINGFNAIDFHSDGSPSRL